MRLHIHGLVAFLTICLISSPAASQSITLDRIRADLAAGSYAAALNGADQFLDANPGHPQARFLKGIALTEQGRTDEAIRVFSALAGEYPDLPEPHNNLAVLYAAKGDYVKARDSLLLAINTHPSYATAHENLGDIYAKMAGLAYDRALELDGQNESAKSKLALMHDLTSMGETPMSVASTAGSDTTTGTPAVETTMAAAEISSEATAAASPITPIDKAGVLAALKNWAAAWSNQDVRRYLGFYAEGFVPPNGLSRQQWLIQREVRITRPAFINISIDNARVEQRGGQGATVVFSQTYESDTYGDQVVKRLEMSQQSGQWVIVRETAVE